MKHSIGGAAASLTPLASATDDHQTFKNIAEKIMPQAKVFSKFLRKR